MTVLHNFAYTGALQTVVVPPGVLGATMECVGGAGGLWNVGGYGAGISVDYLTGLTPGETLYVMVGGGGNSGVPGWPDGGCSAAIQQRGGGGSTSIGRNSSADIDRILVGAGGGGRGPSSTVKGGNGGYSVGLDGLGAGPGLGATQIAGGATHYPGSFGQGGSTPYTTNRPGGGGGGGWYGGGGGRSGSGINASGGGGSSYYDTLDPRVSLNYAEAAGTNGGITAVTHGYASIEFFDPVEAIVVTTPRLEVDIEAESSISNWRYPDPHYVWLHGIDGERVGVLD